VSEHHPGRGALYAAPRPCNTCPYACSTPAGIWAASEYEKLIDYDDNPGPYVVFHCHQETATGVATVCRGWLSVHPDTLAVRLAIAQGRLTVDQRDAPPAVELYRSAAEAAAVGLAAIEAPEDAALRAAERLIERGVGARED
jgi:Family of unknown function (DUF6283)